jgi:hypothetical protein
MITHRILPPHNPKIPHNLFLIPPPFPIPIPSKSISKSLWHFIHHPVVIPVRIVPSLVLRPVSCSISRKACEIWLIGILLGVRVLISIGSGVGVWGGRVRWIGIGRIVGGLWVWIWVGVVIGLLIRCLLISVIW